MIEEMQNNKVIGYTLYKVGEHIVAQEGKAEHVVEIVERARRGILFEYKVKVVDQLYK